VRSDPFFTQRRRRCGVWLRASPRVDERAVDEAERRVERLLGRCDQVVANLARAGAELHVVGRDEAITDLPQYRHLAGVPVVDGMTLDERGRGYGGLFACCSEEMLLRLPSARHSDHRDILAHELAHTVLDFGVSARVRARVEARWRRATERGRWTGAYAATNAQEFFAELTMWWVGSRGDHGTMQAPPADGRLGLLRYDPASHDLVDDVWTGRLDPGHLGWSALRPSAATRSQGGRAATTVVFVNGGGQPAERCWLDGAGREVPYGSIPAHGAVAQPTYAGHAWVVHRAGVRLGPWVATRDLCRIELASSPPEVL
jgi:hypothetical protein